MKKLIILMTLCLLFMTVCFNAYAQQLTSYPVGDLVSVDGETSEAFLKRAGRIMEDLTYKYGFEFCSRIWLSEDGQHYMLNISTVKSHVGCVISGVTVTGGNWIPLNLTIHTHPQFYHSVANESDVLLNRGKYKVGDPITIFADRFSDTDFKSGPGFLVVQEHLLYQDGPSDVTDLGSIDPAQESQ
jgi:hypothetical protein